ncbi:hypothetical protein [Glycomyces sp. NPDC021274]|uniref:hypothetical protein n=1 Tax=Glycomyces sp. NPDC021274 TaxID=3155120 RepID=UPI00340C58BD
MRYRVLSIPLAALLLAACGSNGAETPSEPSASASASVEATDAPTEAESTAPPEPASVLPVGMDSALGISYPDASGGTALEFNFVVTEVEAVTEGMSEFVVFTVGVEVVKGEMTFMFGLWAEPAVSPTLIDANGIEYQTSIRPVGTMLNGTVPEGESIAGHIAFEAPPTVADSGTFQLEIPAPEGTDLLHWTY